MPTPNSRTSLRLQLPGRQRPRGRSTHHGVHIALDVLIQRSGATGNEHRAAESMQQTQPIKRAVRAKIKTCHGGDDYEESNVRLREHHISPRLCMRGNAFGAQFAHARDAPVSTSLRLPNGRD